MKNPFKSLRSAWNRAKVNSPIKASNAVIMGGGSGATTASLLLLAPIDGGVSAFVFAILTGTGVASNSFVSYMMSDEDMYRHDEYKTISHNGEQYKVSYAQAEKYETLQWKISSLNQKHKDAPNAAKRKKFQKKAQKLLNYQEDIIDSKNVRRVSDIHETPDIPLKFRARNPKN